MGGILRTENPNKRGGAFRTMLDNTSSGSVSVKHGDGPTLLEVGAKKKAKTTKKKKTTKTQTGETSGDFNGQRKSYGLLLPV
jgi:hypothetical protein